LPKLPAPLHEASLGLPQPIALLGEPHVELLGGLGHRDAMFDGLPVSRRPGVARADPRKPSHPDERQGGQDEDDGEAHWPSLLAIVEGRYPSGPLVPAVAHAFAAFEQRDYGSAIGALEPIIAELERIGGSRAQLDLVEFTLLQAYVAADRSEDARRMLHGRNRGAANPPVAGLATH